jgi:hypothetical protein
VIYLSSRSVIKAKPKHKKCMHYVCALAEVLSKCNVKRTQSGNLLITLGIPGKSSEGTQCLDPEISM